MNNDTYIVMLKCNDYHKMEYEFWSFASAAQFVNVALNKTCADDMTATIKIKKGEQQSNDKGTA